MNELINEKNPNLKKCFRLVQQRLNEMPAHDLFTYFERQLNFIKSNLRSNGKLPSGTFDKLNIGVLCAKELEHIDNEFCDAVYAMLEEVGPAIDWGFDA